jgi:hypothetical protein
MFTSKIRHDICKFFGHPEHTSRIIYIKIDSRPHDTTHLTFKFTINNLNQCLIELKDQNTKQQTSMEVSFRNQSSNSYIKNIKAASQDALESETCADHIYCAIKVAAAMAQRLHSDQKIFSISLGLPQW